MSFPPFLVRSFEFPHDHTVAPHAHRSNQLIYAIRGAMTIETAKLRWYVPATRGVWMPAEFEHAVQCHGTVSMKTAFVRKDQALGMPEQACEIAISSLLRELLLFSADRDPALPSFPGDQILALIKHQCRVVSESVLSIPRLSDRRLAPIADTLARDPSDGTTLAGWAARLGLSTRTITRRIERDTGMSFLRWKQQVTMLHAVRLLGTGATVQGVAEALGYENPGAFIEAFKRRFGTTPGRYRPRRD